MATYKGFFKPRNPHKYLGDPREIIYRSSWECKCMNYFDLRESIEAWSSEEKFIGYFDPVTARMRRYFPDFIIRYRDKNNNLITEMIEVKPKKEVIGPDPNPKRRTKSWYQAVNTYLTNQSKWKAARKYCEERGWNFTIFTEDQIGSLG